MKIFYDCEFIDDGSTIGLISIGIVAEDGREYYAVNKDAAWKRIRKHAWLVENVVCSLPRLHGDSRLNPGWGNPLALNFEHPAMKRRGDIANEVRDFLLSGDGKPQLWAWYAAYDHVCLAQLWGPMVNIPDGIPMLTYDLKQECDRQGNPDLPTQANGEHNALSDARHNVARAQALGILE